jgi:DinB superfamily
MKRNQITLPEYFDRYINLCDDVELPEAIQISIDELDHFPIAQWNKLGDKVYAPGKWTIKDILQHLIDTERIFMYRALAFARNEKQQMPSFEEDEYVRESDTSKRSIEELVAELRTVHACFKTMFESFTPAMLNRTGKGFKGEYSVASIGFIMPGHQRWHLKVIEEKYLPII